MLQFKSTILGLILSFALAGGAALCLAQQNDDGVLKMQDSQRIESSSSVRQWLFLGGGILLILVASSLALAAFNRSSSNKSAARNLFLKFSFKSKGDDGVGYLRYLDSKKATFITQTNLTKGDEVEFYLKTTGNEELDHQAFTYQIKSIKPLLKQDSWYTVMALVDASHDQQPIKSYVDYLKGPSEQSVTG